MGVMGQGKLFIGQALVGRVIISCSVWHSTVYSGTSVNELVAKQMKFEMSAISPTENTNSWKDGLRS